MKLTHNPAGSAEEQSTSKNQDDKLKGKLRPIPIRMKKVNQGTSVVGDVQNTKKKLQLYPHMSDDQRELIDSAGFGGLLNCRCSQLFLDLCRWLLGCFDAETSELVLSGRGRIPITEAIVHRVIGIPKGSNVIKCEIDASASSFMLNEFGVSKGTQPKISKLFNSLKMNKNANQKYLRTWTIFAACSVITPKFSTKVSPRLYPAVIDSKKIREQNWCVLLIRILKQSRQSDPMKHSSKPCLTFLMIIYLDSLDTGFKRIPIRGCRVSIWTTNLVRKVIAKDTKLDLKSEFTGQDNILFGHDVPLEDFISTHVPESCGHQIMGCIGYLKVIKAMKKIRSLQILRTQIKISIFKMKSLKHKMLKVKRINRQD
ncbi:hypothetical protein C2845_PM05G24970 [Panicum miliaceum]|uniref:Uncharacterized protein n=1 Tax=Panicum miliaceum TaxID=4540 RepID=A0A3L6T3E2_PANMI|nr:hypothetical protein C2845_PM05G24970 [Panicum miliaceum]